MHILDTAGRHMSRGETLEAQESEKIYETVEGKNLKEED
jgi:hypothetical protein